MVNQSLELYRRAHNQIVEASNDVIQDAFAGKMEGRPSAILMTIIQELNSIIVEQGVLLEVMIKDRQDGGTNPIFDTKYFIALINDSLSLNKALEMPMNAKRREALFVIRASLENLLAIESKRVKDQRSWRIWQFRR